MRHIDLVDLRKELQAMTMRRLVNFSWAIIGGDATSNDRERTNKLN